jgi:hypothetical protein
MNTTPDEESLALWVEDELDGLSARDVDHWAAAQPEWLARRDQARRTKSLLQEHLPAVVEPPYGDFFNARIAREIVRSGSPAAAPVRRFWSWLLPTTALAGMVLCFWAGTRMVPAAQVASAPPPPPPPRVGPVLYTPEKGVKASFFEAAPADAMVIVLDGVAAIPDSFEPPESAAVAVPGDGTANLVLPTP